MQANLISLENKFSKEGSDLFKKEKKFPYIADLCIQDYEENILETFYLHPEVTAVRLLLSYVHMLHCKVIQEAAFFFQTRWGTSQFPVGCIAPGGGNKRIRSCWAWWDPCGRDALQRREDGAAHKPSAVNLLDALFALTREPFSQICLIMGWILIMM